MTDDFIDLINSVEAASSSSMTIDEMIKRIERLPKDVTVVDAELFNSLSEVLRRLQIEQRVKIYHALGGNHRLDNYIELVKELPEADKNDKNKVC